MDDKTTDNDGISTPFGGFCTQDAKHGTGYRKTILIYIYNQLIWKKLPRTSPTPIRIPESPTSSLLLLKFCVNPIAEL